MDDFFSSSLFESEVAHVKKRYGPYRHGNEEVYVDVICVSGENQHIEKFVPLVVWRSAEESCVELSKESRASILRGKKIIELGSGTGLCGLLCAKISGSELVVLTDGADDSVEALGESIKLNNLSSRVFAEELQWSGTHANRLVEKYATKFDVCVATDVIYEEASIRILLECASALLNQNGILFLVNHRYRFRNLSAIVNLEAEKVGLTLIEASVLGNDQLIDLYIYRKL